MVDAVVAARRRAAAVIGRLMFGVVHSFSCHAVERRSVVAAKRTHAEMRVQGERGGVASLGPAWLVACGQGNMLCVQPWEGR